MVPNWANRNCVAVQYRRQIRSAFLSAVCIASMIPAFKPGYVIRKTVFDLWVLSCLSYKGVDYLPDCNDSASLYGYAGRKDTLN